MRNQFSSMLTEQNAEKFIQRHTINITNPNTFIIPPTVPREKSYNSNTNGLPRTSTDEEELKDVDTHMTLHPEIWQEFTKITSGSLTQLTSKDKDQAAKCLTRFFHHEIRLQRKELK